MWERGGTTFFSSAVWAICKLDFPEYFNTQKKGPCYLKQELFYWFVSLYSAIQAEHLLLLTLLAHFQCQKLHFDRVKGF